MRKRGVGLLLVLTLIIAAGTIVQDFRFDNSIARERAAGQATDRAFGTALESLSEYRMAQAAYVAAGQTPGSWMTHASEMAAGIESTIANGRAATASPEARGRYEAAVVALGDLNAIDKRARSSIGQSDRFSSSDLVFIDAKQAADKLADELTAIRAFEAQASGARLARLSQLRLAMNGVAMGFVVVVALYLSRSTAPEAKPEPTTLQMLRDLPPPVKNVVPQPAPPPPPPPPPRMVNLAAAADLCVDLARVIDGRDVPSLVERACSVLEAKGIVLWVADAGGNWLTPSVAHGYPERVVAKLGPLQIDADNVTSLAFRSLKPQVMASLTPGASSAIATPLITSSGCVGVLAAELRQNKPASDVLPIASIIAAQLAAFVVPGDLGAQMSAKG
jgi:hypothetical protein